MTRLRAARRFTVDEYHAMGDAGILRPDECVELIEGEVVPMAPVRTVRRFTVDEYHAMGRAGILGPDERVELIEGEVVPMAPIGSRHGGVVDFLTERLGDVARRSNLILRVQGPVHLAERSEPLPDLALLHYRTDRYRQAHPAPADVLLLVEVSDTSVRYDREETLPLYARARIPEVWLVDLEAGVIDVFHSPSGHDYPAHTTHRRGDTVTAHAVAGLKVRVDDVLG